MIEWTFPIQWDESNQWRNLHNYSDRMKLISYWARSNYHWINQL